MGANGEDEDPLSKTGMELFRELLRIYGDAEVEDYYKGGVWKEDLIKTDYELVVAHRKEAGAPDPTPLEDVPVPELPKAPAGAAAFLGQMGVPGVLGVRPLGAVAAGAGAVAAANGPVAELRLIALFVAKWKLDPTRAKMMLTKLLPQRRRHVIQVFKTTATGIEATNALEQFIAQCGKTNSWGSATALAAAPSAVTTALAAATAARAAPTMAGVKRPIGLVAPQPTNPWLDPSKRPRIGPFATGPVAMSAAARATSPAAAALAARLAAARARGPMLMAARPPMQAQAMAMQQQRVAMQQQRMAAMASMGPRGMSPMGVRPAGAGGSMGARPTAAPKAGKPGALIRNLLQKVS